MALIQKVAPTMRVMNMFADCRIFVFSSTLKKVWGSIGDIICIAQADHIQNDKKMHCSLTIDGLASLGLRSCSNFLLIKTGCKVGPIL